MGGEVRVIVIDINRFKHDINDTFGHQIGDKVIIAYAEALRHAARTYDPIGRIGNGDEFGICLEDREATDGTLSKNFVTRVEEHLRAIAETDSDLLRVSKSINGFSASMGLATFLSEDTTTVQELIFKADLAMYNAKKQSPQASKLLSWNTTMRMPNNVHR